jgi:hypothetical protein
LSAHSATFWRRKAILFLSLRFNAVILSTPFQCSHIAPRDEVCAFLANFACEPYGVSRARLGATFPNMTTPTRRVFLSIDGLRCEAHRYRISRSEMPTNKKTRRGADAPRHASKCEAWASTPRRAALFRARPTVPRGGLAVTRRQTQSTIY